MRVDILPGDLTALDQRAPKQLVREARIMLVAAVESFALGQAAANQRDQIKPRRVNDIASVRRMRRRVGWPGTSSSGNRAARHHRCLLIGCLSLAEDVVVRWSQHIRLVLRYRFGVTAARLRWLAVRLSQQLL